MALMGLIAVALLVVAGIWYVLAQREKKRSGETGPRLAGWRLGFAAVAGLLMLFSGGCSLFLVPSALQGDQYVSPEAVMVFGGVPFAVGLLVWWLSLRRGKS